MGWTILTIGIIMNVASVIVIRFAQQSQRKVLTALGFLCYPIGTLTITFSFQYLDLSLAFAYWSGLSTLLALCGGVLLFSEKLSLPKIIFFSFLLVGVTGLSFTA